MKLIKLVLALAILAASIGCGCQYSDELAYESSSSNASAPSSRDLYYMGIAPSCSLSGGCNK